MFANEKAVTTAITGALGGQTDLQVAANALASYAAQQIGEKFGHGEDKNKAAQLASHAILGATLAYLNGGNPAAGGGAAVASEAAADYLTKQYKDNPAYQNDKGEFDANLLPEDVKSSIRDLTSAIGVAVGGTVGDSAFSAQIAGVVGQNAVENNLFGVLTADKKIDKQKNNSYFQALQACKNAQCEKNVITQNALAAMQNVPKVLNVSSSKYKEGEIITNPNDVTGLRYLVVKDGGVMKAKLLPADYQVVFSVNQLNSSRNLVQGGALASVIANTLKSGHDVFAERTLFTNQEITALDRAFAGLEVVGNTLLIGGSVLPKKVSIDSVNISKTSPSFEPEANFSGQVPVRPRDGVTAQGAKQVDTPLGNHLINGEIGGRKNAQVISGGHNVDNFYEILNANNGKVVGEPIQISKGITDIKYQLPNGRVETKTVYDPKVYSDAQMATMANQAAAKAIRNYGVTGETKQVVTINGITFRVPISSYKGKVYIPSAFPINPKSP
ncbi:VENN motif pre-toxin domain-containing protein [Acinetobacter baumannii]|nr:VENN motif pre-toxin domain-containing protein [Acinetobacter baumannii]